MRITYYAILVIFHMETGIAVHYHKQPFARQPFYLRHPLSHFIPQHPRRTGQKERALDGILLKNQRRKVRTHQIRG